MGNGFIANFNYEENVEQETKQEEEFGERANFVKMKVGKNKLRFVPPTEKCPKVMHRIDLHWIFINGKKVPVMCLKMGGGPCPICEDATAHYKIGDKNGASAKAAKTQYLYNVMTEDGKLAVLGADKKLKDEIKRMHEAIQKYSEVPFNFFDVKDGVWVVVEKTQTHVPKKAPPFDKENHFKVEADGKRGSCPITDEMAATIVEGVKDLTTLYKLYTYEELSKKYYGTEEAPVPTEEPVPATTATGPGVLTGAVAAEPTDEPEEPPLVDSDEVNKFISDLSL